jgi:hypothetical protein
VNKTNADTACSSAPAYILYIDIRPSSLLSTTTKRRNLFDMFF